MVRHVSRELVRRGHEVTVATTRLPHREETELDGVRIEEFEVSGNAVQGLDGEVERYRSFVSDGGFDVVMTYAAQQWTTDALLPVLDRIRGGNRPRPVRVLGARRPRLSGLLLEPAGGPPEVRRAHLPLRHLPGHRVRPPRRARQPERGPERGRPRGVREHGVGFPRAPPGRSGYSAAAHRRPAQLDEGPRARDRGLSPGRDRRHARRDREQATATGLSVELPAPGADDADRERRPQAGQGPRRPEGRGACCLQGRRPVRLRLPDRGLSARPVRGGRVRDAVHQHRCRKRRGDRRVDGGRRDRPVGPRGRKGECEPGGTSPPR